MYVIKTQGRRGRHRWKTPKDMVWCVNKMVRCESLDEAVDLMFDAQAAEIKMAKAPTLWDVYGVAV